MRLKAFNLEGFAEKRSLLSTTAENSVTKGRDLQVRESIRECQPIIQLGLSCRTECFQNTFVMFARSRGRMVTRSSEAVRSEKGPAGL